MSSEPFEVGVYFNLAICLNKAREALKKEDTGSVAAGLFDLKDALLAVSMGQDAKEAGELANKMLDNTKGVLSVIPLNHHCREGWEVVNSASATIHRELPGKKALFLDKNAVIDALHKAKDGIKYEEERVLLEDTVRCLETEAFRAATVMGWSLAYEHLRRWIFHKPRTTLKKFNGVLTQKNKSKINTYGPIIIFEDFYDLGERFVVDIAYEAKLFNKQKHQILLNALTDRNHFAHPSYRKATSATASGYIENLLINIVTFPGFKI